MFLILQMMMQPSYFESIIVCTSFETPIPNVMEGKSTEIYIKHEKHTHYAVHKSDIFLKQNLFP